jgi:hypothetical protein
LTLIICGAASFALFSRVQHVLTRRLQIAGTPSATERARHVALTAASFVAFLTFYTFAGAPTLRKFPWIVSHIFLVAVVTAAATSLVRRLDRTRELFSEGALPPSRKLEVRRAA